MGHVAMTTETRRLLSGTTFAVSPLVAGTPVSPVQELLTRTLWVGGDRGEIRGDGTGRERVEVKDGEFAHWPSGPRRRPNNGCQRCTQVKLKWLQCEGK